MLFFRVDGTRETGMGHAFRCLNLAQQLSKSSDIIFFCNKSRKTKDLILSKGFIVADPEYVSDFVDENTEKIVIVTDLIEESSTTSWCQSIEDLKNIVHVGIHDLGLNQFDCNVQIDGSIGNVYPYRSEEDESYYLGKDYMILDPLFAKYNTMPKKYSDTLCNILVSFGGSDPSNISEKVLPILSKTFPGFCFKLIAGPEKGSLSDEITQLENVVILKGLSSLADIMFNVDLIITAGGIMLYEAACVGTPSIAICHDKNQLVTAARFSDYKVSHNMGLVNDSMIDELIRYINEISKDKKSRQTMGNLGRELIDGRGVFRVSEIISDLLE